MQTAEFVPSVSQQRLERKIETTVADREPIRRRRKKLDLTTVRGCRDELIANYRLVKRKKLDSAEANRLALQVRIVAEMNVFLEGLAGVRQQLEELRAEGLIGSTKALPEF